MLPMTVVSCAELYCIVLNTTADLSVWRKYQTTVSWEFAGSLPCPPGSESPNFSPSSAPGGGKEKDPKKDLPWFGSFPILQIRMKSWLIYQSLQVITVFK